MDTFFGDTRNSYARVGFRNWVKYFEVAIVFVAFIVVISIAIFNATFEKDLNYINAMNAKTETSQVRLNNLRISNLELSKK